MQQQTIQEFFRTKQKASKNNDDDEDVSPPISPVPTVSKRKADNSNGSGEFAEENDPSTKKAKKTMEDDTSTDICDCADQNVTDEMKNHFIKDRLAEPSFKFPSRQYKDKRSKSGVMNRTCCRDWLTKFDFLSYSKRTDGLYCVACVLFPDTAHRRPRKLIIEPYRNWKDALQDMKVHSTNAYHKSSMAKLEAFKRTYGNPSAKINVQVDETSKETVKRNRRILMSIVETLELCGRQGVALRGHRDDGLPAQLDESNRNMGNFKALISYRISGGDEILKDHIEKCNKNATYMSKTAQNELLKCIKDYIQAEIVKQIKNQSFGEFYGLQGDEVRDSSNWEQLGIVLRYTKDNKPVEKLIEFVPCESITGAKICEYIINCLEDVKLDPGKCRSMTMDGAGNMAGRQNGCAAKFREKYPKALYHYCSSHDLNLALCKSCSVKDVQLMLDTVKQIGIFFKYSPKRSRFLEKAVEQSETDLNKSKISMFCETRWTEKHSTMFDFNSLYEPLLSCLEDMYNGTDNEITWDSKTTGEAFGLLKRITDSKFIAAFQTVLHFFGFTQSLSRKLQSSSIDVTEAYKMIDLVRSVLTQARQDDGTFTTIYNNMENMASKAGVNLQMPRICGRQTQRSNVEADSPAQYFKRSVYIPYIDALLQQFNMRFSNLTKQAMEIFNFLPSKVSGLDKQSIQDVYEHYKEDMPFPESFHQEVTLYQQLWKGEENLPGGLQETVQDARFNQTLFPNISTILQISLVTSVTAASVERGNSSLKFIKTPTRSTMKEDRLNALVLLFIHRDIKLDYDKIVSMFAERNRRRMMLLNPLSD